MNTLDRPADRAGLDYWTGALNSGLSRAEVVLAFSESREHVALTAANIQTQLGHQFRKCRFRAAAYAGVAGR